jgi:hypothetical protein
MAYSEPGHPREERAMVKALALYRVTGTPEAYRRPLVFPDGDDRRPWRWTRASMKRSDTTMGHRPE